MMNVNRGMRGVGYLTKEPIASRTKKAEYAVLKTVIFDKQTPAPDKISYMAGLNDQEIGELVLFRRNDYIELAYISVLSDKQNIGVGLKLMQIALMTASELKCGLVVHLSDNNPFYASLGFYPATGDYTRIRETPKTYLPEKENDHLVSVSKGRVEEPYATELNIHLHESKLNLSSAYSGCRFNANLTCNIPYTLNIINEKLKRYENPPSNTATANRCAIL